MAGITGHSSGLVSHVVRLLDDHDPPARLGAHEPTDEVVVDLPDREQHPDASRSRDRGTRRRADEDCTHDVVFVRRVVSPSPSPFEALTVG